MATRINTKVVMIVLIAVVAAAGILGGLLFLQMRGSAERFVRLAAEKKQSALESRDEGDMVAYGDKLRKAKDLYARAVLNDPANTQNLRLMEETLLEIRPYTQDEARELYGQWLSTMAHEITHNPADPELHLRFLREAYEYGARVMNLGEHWRMIVDLADDMYNRVPSSRPERAYALLYRGTATLRLIAELEPQEILQAEADLIEFLKEVPDSDLGWASLAIGQRTVAVFLDANDRTLQGPEGIIDDATMLARCDETLRQAREHVPNGPEVTRVEASITATKRWEDPTSVDEQELRATVDKLVALIREEEEPGLVLDAAGVLRFLRFENSQEMGIELLEGYLRRHPDALYHRLALAEALYFHGEYDRAVAAAREVLDAEPLLVCFMAQYQRLVSAQAASIIMNVRFAEWEMASEADRSQALEPMRATREELASLVDNPDNDPLLKEAEGKLAYAEGKYDEAAACFEWLIRFDPDEQIEPQILLFAARCLKNIGQVGLAHERLEKAATDNIGNVFILLEKARIEGQLREFEQMSETLDEILRIEPENETALVLKTQVEQALSDSAVPTDPVVAVISEALQAAQSGDYDSARNTLTNLQQRYPDHVAVPMALWQLEMLADNQDQAQMHLDRARELDPENLRLVELDQMLNEPDPIRRVYNLVVAATEDEVEQVVILYVRYRMQADRARRLASQREGNGDIEGAKASRDLAARADQEAAAYLTRAMSAAPDHPALVEGRFQQALLDENWELAEQLANRAVELNIDQANGLIYRGRYELHRRDFETAILTLVEATEVKPYSAPAWTALAVAYQNVGNLDDAERAYEEAYRINPNDMNTVREFVRLLLPRGKTTRALLILQTARLVAPNDEDIRDLWLALEVDIGDKPLALKTRRRLYRDNPENITNAMRLAALLGKLEPSYDLLLDADGEPRYTIGSWARLVPEEQERRLTQERERWNQEVDEILQRLFETQGQNLALIRLQTELLRIRGECERGEQIFREFVSSHDESEITSGMLIQLAQFHLQCFHVREALETMEEARQYQDPQRLEVDAALAGMLFRAKQWSRALELYEGVIAVAPSTAAKFRLVECLVKLGRLDEAQQRLEEALQETEEDYFACMLQATILDGQAEVLFDQGLTEQGEQRLQGFYQALERAKVYRPDLTIPYLLRANSLLKSYWRTASTLDDRGLLEDALAELNNAENVRAGEPDIVLTRAEVLLGTRDRRGAIGELNRFLEAQPENIKARKRMVELLQEERRYGTAHTAIDEALVFAKDLALWHEMKGDLYIDEARRSPEMSTEDKDELKRQGVESYQSAYSLRPNLAMLTKLTDAGLSVSSPNYEIIVGMLESMTAELDNEPLLRVLFAKALNGGGQRDRALEELAKAFRAMKLRIRQGEAAPSSIAGWFLGLPAFFDRDTVGDAEALVTELCEGELGVYEMHWLSVMWRDSGPAGSQRMLELAESALAACPPDEPAMKAGLSQELGHCRLLVEDWAGAAEAFETVLEIQPDNALILNDYAYLRAERLNDPAGALEYAETAMRLAPDSPSVLDTYGWILFKLGDLEKAQRSIQRALVDDETAEKCVHMAHVLLAQGQLEDAERQLQRAAELRPDPQTQAEIEGLADDIRTRRGQGR
ncbi:MAG: tetratricopeptide repeat protein [Phycisphaerales bacterium]|nr:MAG: tetratricopeptide repeat protein [Phycisphaerales bacterium]